MESIECDTVEIASTTKKKTKERWSRGQKRQRKEEQEQGQEESRKSEDVEESQQKQKQKPPLKKSSRSTQTTKQRIIQCAMQAATTGSLQIHLPGDDAQGTDQTHINVITASGDVMKLTSNKEVTGSTIYVKPLLILDLNGILCHRIRPSKPDQYSKVPFRPKTTSVACTPLVLRPGLDHFLNFLDQSFTLAVWTSAKPKSAKKLLARLMPSALQQRLLFTWAQNKCRCSRQEDQKEPIYIKALDKVWSEYPLFNAANTILLDDSAEKCPNLFKANTLHPPALNGKESSELISMSDQENVDLQMDFFVKLCHHFCSPRTTYSTMNQSEQGENSSDASGLLHTFLEKHAEGHMGWRGKS